jgi:hypothetical protein
MIYHPVYVLFEIFNCVWNNYCTEPWTLDNFFSNFATCMHQFIYSILDTQILYSNWHALRVYFLTLDNFCLILLRVCNNLFTLYPWHPIFYSNWCAPCVLRYACISFSLPFCACSLSQRGVYLPCWRTLRWRSPYVWSRQWLCWRQWWEWLR